MPPSNAEDWVVVEGETKMCPMCAETIPAAARVCSFCGAHFEVIVRGYCPQDHAQVPSDVHGKCTLCGTDLVDRHRASRLLSEPAKGPEPALRGPTASASSERDSSTTPPPPQAASPTPPRGGARSGSARKRPGCFRTFALLVIALGAALIAREFLPGSRQAAPPQSAATATRQATATPRPTATDRPTRTPTPPPVEITFEELDALPVGTDVIITGRLALFSSTRCGLTCGLLLEDIANPSREITILVNVVSPGQQAEPNQMESLPDQYVKSDIRVRTDDGTYAAVGFRLRITGQICETTSGSPCISDITKIELVTVD